MSKALNIIKRVLTWALVVVAVGMMIFTVFSVNTFDRNDRDIFGYKAYIVRSDSMSSVNGDTSQGYFKAGDLIFVKEVDPSTLQKDDIISYISTNTDNFGETVTHKIKELTTDASGNPGFVTYGTATGEADDNVVIYPYVLGQYKSKLVGIGYFFTFVKTTPGYIVCILLPFILLIGINGFNSIRLFRKYKSEQLAELEEQREREKAELQAEREAIAAERQKQEEMMQKLLEMQAALQGREARPQAPAEDNETSEN